MWWSYTRKKQILIKKATCKTQNFYILLAFVLITIALLIAVSIYCYLIKYWEKRKHLLPFHFINNKKLYIKNIKKKISNKAKDKDIKKLTHYFFNDAIDIKKFDPNNIKTDKTSYKNILIY